MSRPDCSHCSDAAKGLDEDGEFTCGAACCMPVERPMPAVIEESGEDEECDE